MNTIKHNSKQLHPKRGRLAAILIAIMPKKKLKPTRQDLQRIEFKTSTKRMGISFTEKIRNNFRSKWLKKR
jgi:hypothetical protein